MNTIVLISDDNYVLPTMVMIKSIIDNYDNQKELRVCVVSWKLSNENIRKFNLLSGNNVEVKTILVDPEKYGSRMKKINQNTHVTPTALLKFEIADILKCEDVALYLDGDMVCKRDLSHLFEMDLEENYVAASFEFLKYVACRYSLKEGERIPFYFNSGVMLLNLKKMRQNHISEELWDAKLKSHNIDSHGKGGLMDQDVFNEVFDGKVKHLPITYNCNCNFVNYTDLKAINNIYMTSFKTPMELESAVSIIHYVGKTDKPWKYKNVACQEYWDMYYKKLGMNVEDLNRVTTKKDMNYYIGKIKDSINSRGIIDTMRYYTDKFTRH